RRFNWDNSERDHVEAARRNSGVPFLKGPVPLPWLRIACRLPGRALQAALCIRYVEGLTSSSVIKPSGKQRSCFALSRRGWYEALRRLEKAGLILVERKPGCSSQITVLTVMDLQPAV